MRMQTLLQMKIQVTYLRILSRAETIAHASFRPSPYFIIFRHDIFFLLLPSTTHLLLQG